VQRIRHFCSDAVCVWHRREQVVKRGNCRHCQGLEGLVLQAAFDRRGHSSKVHGRDATSSSSGSGGGHLKCDFIQAGSVIRRRAAAHTSPWFDRNATDTTGRLLLLAKQTSVCASSSDTELCHRNLLRSTPRELAPGRAAWLAVLHAKSRQSS